MPSDARPRHRPVGAAPSASSSTRPALPQHDGNRPKKRYDQTADFRVYYLKSTLKGRPVETQFQVPRFSRKALVEDLCVLITDRPA